MLSSGKSSFTGRKMIFIQKQSTRRNKKKLLRKKPRFIYVFLAALHFHVLHTLFHSFLRSLILQAILIGDTQIFLYVQQSGFRHGRWEQTGVQRRARGVQGVRRGRTGERELLSGRFHLSNSCASSVPPFRAGQDRLP